MEPIIVKNIAELIKAVDKIFTSTNSRWWFRGQMNEKWDLLPYVKRSYSKDNERYMTNLFYTGAKSRYPNCPSAHDYGAWLALMQHHGLPTRLLDWTHSLIVAAYFATKYSFDMDQQDNLTDAAIWSLDPIELNISHGYEDVFPPLDARSVVSMVRPAFKGVDIDKPAVLAVAPIESDMKIFAQHGTFTVHVSDKPLNLMDGSEAWLRKIIVPKQHVPNMALELDALGLRLSDYFPDLYHLARDIKRGRSHK